VSVSVSLDLLLSVGRAFAIGRARPGTPDRRGTSPLGPAWQLIAHSVTLERRPADPAAICPTG
jgi:hypothetical protein